MGLIQKFKAGLAKTHGKLAHEIKRIVTRSPRLDAASLEELEAALIAADLGLAVTAQIVAAVKHAYETQGTAGLDYLAMGHWHSAVEGRAGSVTYAYSGAPEPVAVDQDGAGQVLIVTLDDRGGRHVVTVEPKRVGQTRSEKFDLDVSGVHSQPELIDVLGRHADSNLVFDVRLTGLFPDDLDMDLDEVERALAPSFLRFRLRDQSIPAAPEGAAPPPPDTVVGAFVRNVESQIFALSDSAGPADSGPDGSVSDPEREEELDDLREVLRLGRHLLEGRQVTL